MDGHPSTDSSSTGGGTAYSDREKLSVLRQAYVKLKTERDQMETDLRGRIKELALAHDRLTQSALLREKDLLTEITQLKELIREGVSTRLGTPAPPNPPPSVPVVMPSLLRNPAAGLPPSIASPGRVRAMSEVEDETAGWRDRVAQQRLELREMDQERDCLLSTLAESESARREVIHEVDKLREQRKAREEEWKRTKQQEEEERHCERMEWMEQKQTLEATLLDLRTKLHESEMRENTLTQSLQSLEGKMNVRDVHERALQERITVLETQVESAMSTVAGLRCLLSAKSAATNLYEDGEQPRPFLSPVMRERVPSKELVPPLLMLNEAEEELLRYIAEHPGEEEKNTGECGESTLDQKGQETVPRRNSRPRRKKRDRKRNKKKENETGKGGEKESENTPEKEKVVAIGGTELRFLARRSVDLTRSLQVSDAEENGADIVERGAHSDGEEPVATTSGGVGSVIVESPEQSTRKARRKGKGERGGGWLASFRRMLSSSGFSGRHGPLDPAILGKGSPQGAHDWMLVSPADQAIRQYLLTKTKRTVRQVVKRAALCSPHATEYIIHDVNQLCLIMERIWCQGLVREPIASIFCEFVETSIRRRVERGCSDVDCTSLETLGIEESDVGRCRAWVRQALNEKCLRSYMALLLEDTELLSEWYEPAAFLRDDDLCSLFLSYLAVLETVDFQLDLRDLTSNIALDADFKSLALFGSLEESSLFPEEAGVRTSSSEFSRTTPEGPCTTDDIDEHEVAEVTPVRRKTSWEETWEKETLQTLLRMGFSPTEAQYALDEIELGNPMREEHVHAGDHSPVQETEHDHHDGMETPTGDLPVAQGEGLEKTTTPRARSHTWADPHSTVGKDEAEEVLQALGWTGQVAGAGKVVGEVATRARGMVTGILSRLAPPARKEMKTPKDSSVS